MLRNSLAEPIVNLTMIVVEPSAALSARAKRGELTFGDKGMIPLNSMVGSPLSRWNMALGILR